MCVQSGRLAATPLWGFHSLGAVEGFFWNHDWLLIASLPNTSVPSLDPNISARKSRDASAGGCLLPMWHSIYEWPCDWKKNKKRSNEERTYNVVHLERNCLWCHLQPWEMNGFLFFKTEEDSLKETMDICPKTSWDCAFFNTVEKKTAAFFNVCSCLVYTSYTVICSCGREWPAASSHFFLFEILHFYCPLHRYPLKTETNCFTLNKNCSFFFFFYDVSFMRQSTKTLTDI